jgi:hypothetical protein
MPLFGETKDLQAQLGSKLKVYLNIDVSQLQDPLGKQGM